MMNKKIRKKLAFTLYLSVFICIPFAGIGQSMTWARNATGANLFGFLVTTDPSGNVFGAGQNVSIPATTVSFGSVTFPGYDGQGVWVKYDPSGNVLWAGGTVSGTVQIGGITTDQAGNFIIFGRFGTPTMQIGSFTLTNSLFGVGSGQFFIAKLNPSGTVLWAIKDGENGNTPAAMGLSIPANGGVTTDASGNIYIVSSFYQPTITVGTTILTNRGSADVFLAKYTPAGTAVWANSIGGGDEEYSIGITVDPNGYIYIAGDFYSSSITVGPSVINNPYNSVIGPHYYTSRAFIAKFSPAGLPLWAEAAGGDKGGAAFSITHDNCDNIYVSGIFGDTSISFGSSTFTRAFPSGASTEGVNALFVVQFSPADVVTWGKTISSPTKTLNGFSVAVPSCGQVWVDGAYNEKAVIDSGDTLALQPGFDPSFIAGFNVAGGVVGYTGVGSGGYQVRGIACSPSGDVYICANTYAVLGYTYYVIGHDTITGLDGFYVAKYANTVTIDTTYAHNDTIMCIDSVNSEISGPPGFCSYLWDNDSTTIYRKISAPGTYFVYCYACGSVLVDTFHVALTGPDTTFHHQDTFVCSNDVPFILNGPAGYLAYSWNTGATTPSITASAAGDYFVLALSPCGTLNDTFKVVIIPPPVISLGKDTSFCTGNPITLSSDQPPGYTWLWSTGSTGPSIRVSSPGIYWVRVGNQGCFTTDTINITLTPPSASGHLTNVTPNETITYGSDIQLNADNEWLYVWKPNDGSLNDPNINDPVATPLHTTLYTVYGYDHQGCMDSATVVINVDSTMKECVPNSFTPNGDGLNDVFMPICVRFQKMVDLRIYNRWGQLVFFSTSMESGWDGTFNGVPQDMDTYFYMITIARPGGNVIYKGDVTLIR